MLLYWNQRWRQLIQPIFLACVYKFGSLTKTNLILLGRQSLFLCGEHLFTNLEIGNKHIVMWLDTANGYIYHYAYIVPMKYFYKIFEKFFRIPRKEKNCHYNHPSAKYQTEGIYFRGSLCKHSKSSVHCSEILDRIRNLL